MSSLADDSPKSDLLVIRTLGVKEYEPLWRAMQKFTETRTSETPDEIWFTEHPSIFTLGLNASRDHLLAPGNIPVLQVDRGGQVTYHGPGQLMIYPLIDLKRSATGVRSLVTALEKSTVDLLEGFGIEACSRKDAPGVYVDGRKIASVGLRVRRGASYHGMALNIDVDLEPFARINPCGFKDLEVTDLRTIGVVAARNDIQDQFQRHLLDNLSMSDRRIVSDD